MKTKIFIDGREGTTGLRIDERLRGRPELTLLSIDAEKRKDPGERRRLVNEADIVFLCLPDEAARESAALVENPRTRVLDASTAHRTAPGWVYGFPELSRDRREAAAGASRLAVPGCHASGFVSLAYPLVRMGLLPAGAPLCCHSVTGYSGGGRKMIADYAPPLKPGYDSPRHYGLTLAHKHLPEMQKICGLEYAPLFCPIVGNFYAGMVVSLPLPARLLSSRLTARDVWEFFTAYYEGQRLVRVMPFGGGDALTGGTLDASGIAGRDDMEIYVFGHDEQILLCSRFDNLGKGASGAAVQCMNLMLGLDETTGLNIAK